MGKVLSKGFWRAALALSFATVSGLGPVGAQSDGTLIEDRRDAVPAFAIAPSGEIEGAFFAVMMEPGETETLTASLVNAAETALHARTFAADTYTIVNGGMGVREAGSETTGVTTWIDYPTETLTLAPSSTTERSFTVTVPDDAPPGQHLTGDRSPNRRAASCPGKYDLRPDPAQVGRGLYHGPGAGSPGAEHWGGITGAG